MEECEILAETRSVFSEAMDGDEEFPFSFLQVAGGGTKTLAKPKLSSSFKWNAKQVMGLGQITIYILAERELQCEKCTNATDSSDDDFDDHPSKRSRTNNPDDPSHTPDSVVPLPPPHPHTDSSRPGPSHSSSVPPPLVRVQSTEATPPKGNASYDTYCSLLETLPHEYGPDLSDQEAEADGMQMAILESIQNSSAEMDRPISPGVPLKHVLNTHRRRVISECEEEECSRVFIIRTRLWQNALKAFKRPSFDVGKHIKVVFVGEPCEDAGGPLREFFTILIHEMVVKSGLFEGEDGHAVPAHNTTALLAGDFRICGMMVATAICHGGRAPHCFSQSFAEYIIYGKLLSPVNCLEIPDADIRLKMQKLQECTTDDQLQFMLGGGDFDFRFDCGYSKPITTITKEEMIRTITAHFVLYRVLAEIEQFREGLKSTLNFGRLMQEYADQLLPLLLPLEQPLSAMYLQDLLTPQYSVSGSNLRQKEESVFHHWVEYLQDAQDGATVMTLPEVMMFLTGTTVPPPTGFDKKPQMIFTAEKRLPQADTCSMRLAVWRNYISYENFKEDMEFSIPNSQGFGLV